MGDARGKDPWDWFQPHDVKRFGEVILDRSEQTRWSRAVFLGGLPYMWRRAEVLRGIIYERLELKPGDNVLVIGEVLEGCGFVSDMRERIGPEGVVHAVDIVDDARDSYLAGRRGRGGQLATWRFDYTRECADEHFDCVAVLQGVQHCDDWRDVGGELLRVMKPGRNIVLAEINFGPEFRMKMQLDLHIEYLLEKIFARIGWDLDQIPYYSTAQLREAFSGIVTEEGAFSWRGADLFWGRKPQTRADGTGS